jgi:uncharacterized membrane protein YoaK (UPF0700 family)
MSSIIDQLRATLVPNADPKHGPLPPMLIGLTVVTGLVDAFSYLTLGHVFTANMTGNVVFVGFALAGAKGFSVTASLCALAGFWLGALVGGGLRTRHANRGRLLSVSATVQLAFLAVSLGTVLVAAAPVGTAPRYILIAALALSMGVQNAAARHLAVPDLTTTVLTMTITGLSADSGVVGGTGANLGRRGLSLIAMLVGAIVGAVLVLKVALVWPIAVAALIVAVVALSAGVLSRREAEWLSR